ncbi:S8 family serine peptidase [Phenylobacterium koreense]|uniref:Peptidase S8/S53 domain-containing protein n=1 Tax=Phenylobacterium koreense TaxID=266125 RepID=A0ABV2EJC3_9CAUL
MSHAQGRGGGLGLGGGIPDVSAITDRALARHSLPDTAFRGLERAQAASSTAAERAVARVAQVRQRLAEDRRRAVPVLATDRTGHLVVRNEVVAVAASEASLAAARQAGFSILRRTSYGPLDLEVTVLAAPPGMATDRAVALLRERDPAGAYDFNHLYDGAGLAPQGQVTAGRRGSASVGMIDSGVDIRAEALRGVRIEQRGFVGPASPQPHGSAVAAILAAPGGDVGSLRVADVYGANPTGGSAEAIVAGMAWLAQSGTPVINISLVGPPNLLLGAAVQSLVSKGFLLVAPAGNDGPASKDTYPASYRGVIAVSAVDSRGRLLPEASQPSHIDFVALGLTPPPGSAGKARPLRGTSFAAPVVAARLAGLMTAPSRTAARRAIDELASTARDLGTKGKDARFGYGWVEASSN